MLRGCCILLSAILVSFVSGGGLVFPSQAQCQTACNHISNECLSVASDCVADCQKVGFVSAPCRDRALTCCSTLDFPGSACPSSPGYSICDNDDICQNEYDWCSPGVSHTASQCDSICSGEPQACLIECAGAEFPDTNCASLFTNCCVNEGLPDPDGYSSKYGYCRSKPCKLEDRNCVAKGRPSAGQCTSVCTNMQNQCPAGYDTDCPSDCTEASFSSTSCKDIATSCCSTIQFDASKCDGEHGWSDCDDGTICENEFDNCSPTVRSTQADCLEACFNIETRCGQYYEGATKCVEDCIEKTYVTQICKESYLNCVAKFPFTLDRCSSDGVGSYGWSDVEKEDCDPYDSCEDSGGEPTLGECKELCDHLQQECSSNFDPNCLSDCMSTLWTNEYCLYEATTCCASYDFNNGQCNSAGLGGFGFGICNQNGVCQDKWDLCVHASLPQANQCQAVCNNILSQCGAVNPDCFERCLASSFVSDGCRNQALECCATARWTEYKCYFDNTDPPTYENCDDAEICPDEFDAELADGFRACSTSACLNDEDYEDQCASWSSRGFCETFPFFMGVKCRATCGYCGCADDPAYTSFNDCNAIAGQSPVACENAFIASKCPDTCGVCVAGPTCEMVSVSGDIGGTGYAHFSAPSRTQCAQFCCDAANCVAYKHSQSAVIGEDYQCILLDSDVETAVSPFEDYITEKKPSSATCTMESVSGDIGGTGFAQPEAPTRNQCKQKCCDNSNCLAYKHSASSVFGEIYQCILLDSTVETANDPFEDYITEKKPGSGTCAFESVSGDVPGTGYLQVHLPARVQCEAACCGDSTCKTYKHSVTAAIGDDYQCILMNDEIPTVPDSFQDYFTARKMDGTCGMATVFGDIQGTGYAQPDAPLRSQCKQACCDAPDCQSYKHSASAIIGAQWQCILMKTNTATGPDAFEDYVTERKTTQDFVGAAAFAVPKSDGSADILTNNAEGGQVTDGTGDSELNPQGTAGLPDSSVGGNDLS